MVLNREALHEIDQGILRGMEGVALEIAEKVDPHIPDGPEFGEGLVDRGVMWLSYVDGKKVGGDPRVHRKPSAFKVRGQGVSVAVGMGFPSRFYEMGTVRQPPRPFFSPVVESLLGAGVVQEAMYRSFRSILTKQAIRLQRRYNTAPSALLGRFR